MERINLETNQILSYSKKLLSYYKEHELIINNAKYHHNADYKDAVSICIHGVLSPLDLYKKKIKNYDLNTLQIMSDTSSHINGNDAISLSVQGLNDLYEDEEVYESDDPYLVDFLISSDVKASRFSEHYGNEYLSFSPIKISDIYSIDIRLLKLIEGLEKKDINVLEINKFIEKLNYLKKICMITKKNNLNIPIREVSLNKEILMNVDKIIDSPILELKI